MIKKINKLKSGKQLTIDNKQTSVLARWSNERMISR